MLETPQAPGGLWPTNKAGCQRQPGWLRLWPAVCYEAGMSAIVYKVSRKSGDYIKAGFIPSNHSEESHFGVVDGVVVGFLLVCAGGLLCLLALS
jgi:hypothetical protein